MLSWREMFMKIFIIQYQVIIGSCMLISVVQALMYIGNRYVPISLQIVGCSC